MVLAGIKLRLVVLLCRVESLMQKRYLAIVIMLEWFTLRWRSLRKLYTFMKWYVPQGKPHDRSYFTALLKIWVECNQAPQTFVWGVLRLRCHSSIFLFVIGHDDEMTSTYMYRFYYLFHYLLLQAVTCPAVDVSHIMLEAYKKFILVSLILHGKVRSPWTLFLVLFVNSVIRTA